tara:strand:+ start:13125 stop:13625 length:501 start_codon:yes stop_codon:yes gene_type:complete
MLQVRQNYVEKNGIVQENNTTQYYNDGENIVIKTRDKYGHTNIEEIPIKQITDFRGAIEDEKQDLSIFDRLNRDFNMEPDEITNPFILSSRVPQPVSRENRLIMPYEDIEQDLPKPKPKSKSKHSRKRKPVEKKTPRKKRKSPERKPKKTTTRRNYRPYGNKIIRM